MPVWLIIVVALAVIGVVLIIAAPWKAVRDEKPLPEDVETRLLLGESPRDVAADTDRADGSDDHSGEPRPRRIPPARP